MSFQPFSLSVGTRLLSVSEYPMSPLLNTGGLCDVPTSMSYSIHRDVCIQAYVPASILYSPDVIRIYCREGIDTSQCVLTS